MTPLDRLPDRARLRLRVLAWRARRPLAALCVGLAVLLAIDQVRPPQPPTAAVPVAARDLPAGTELTARDVVERVLPVDLVPAALLERVGQESPIAHGERLAVAVPAGLPLVPDLLVDDSATGPPGTVVVPVRFADSGVADVLRPGMRVDVVGSPLLDGDEPVRLAHGAVVLSRPDAVSHDTSGSDGSAGGSAGGGLFGGGATDDDPPVLLAVTPDESVSLSGAAGSRSLGAVIVG